MANSNVEACLIQLVKLNLPDLKCNRDERYLTALTLITNRTNPFCIFLTIRLGCAPTHEFIWRTALHKASASHEHYHEPFFKPFLRIS